MASLSPVLAGQPVAEAKFVRTILLPALTPSLRRVFRDSDHADRVPGSDAGARRTALVYWNDAI